MHTLRDTWVMRGSQLVAEGDAAEITILLGELERLSSTDGGWRQLLRHPSDGALWELSYPQSDMHGGGPRLLVQLDITVPSQWL